VGKEATFKITQNSISRLLTFTDDSIFISSEELEYDSISEFPLSKILAVTCADGGIAFTLQEGELLAETNESLQIKKTFDTAIETTAWKQGKVSYKKKLLPQHDNDYEESVRNSRVQLQNILYHIKNSELTSLDLSFSAIHGSDLLQIFQFLSADTCVKHIDLSGYASYPNEIATLLNIVESSELIESLNLSYCGLQDDSSLAIGEFLKRNKSVTNLNLVFNQFSQEGLVNIFEGLKMNGYVKQFAISLPKVKIGKLRFWMERIYRNRERDILVKQT